MKQVSFSPVFPQFFFKESREAETGDFRGLETKVVKLKVVFSYNSWWIEFPGF